MKHHITQKKHANVGSISDVKKINRLSKFDKIDKRKLHLSVSNSKATVCQVIDKSGINTSMSAYIQ